MFFYFKRQQEVFGQRLAIRGLYSNSRAAVLIQAPIDPAPFEAMPDTPSSYLQKQTRPCADHIRQLLRIYDN